MHYLSRKLKFLYFDKTKNINNYKLFFSKNFANRKIDSRIAVAEYSVIQTLCFPLKRDIVQDVYFKIMQNEELSTPHRVALARQKWEARTVNQDVSLSNNGIH